MEDADPRRCPYCFEPIGEMECLCNMCFWVGNAVGEMTQMEQDRLMLEADRAVQEIRYAQSS